MKTAISIPQAIYEDAERLAAQRGWSRSELYARALAEFVRSERFLGVRERLDAVYGADPAQSELDPALARAQSRAVADGEW